MTPTQLLNKYPIISDQITKRELEIILTELQSILGNGVEGDIVEFGCYEGTTSLFLQRMLTESSKVLHVYDSFEGLPEKTDEDISPIGLQFTAGKLNASKKNFINNFKKASLPLPIIHKNWFKNFRTQDLPNTVALAFLDGDFYESINDSIRLIEPSLKQDSVVIIDDYDNEALPGAKLAVDEWQKRRNFKLRREASLAIIRFD